VLIVESTLHDLFRAIPGALTIWLALVAATVIGCAFIAIPALHDWYRAARIRAEAARLRRVHLGAQAKELGRQGDDLAVAAARSAVTAQRRQEEWEALRRAREAAWRAFDAADTVARRVGSAAAFPLPATPLTTQEELRARERYLHRTATAAYRRGEISVADLSEILSHRNGWDPHRHPADHEIALRRLARQRLFAAYESVVPLELAARHGAEVAATAARSLHDEAFAVLSLARRAEAALAAESQPRRRYAAVSRPARAATAA
jgi:hypothetical protein